MYTVTWWWWWRYVATSLIDRYAARQHTLQNICLATFAVMYDVVQSSTMTGETQDVNTEQDNNNDNNKFIYIALGLQLMHVISQALYNVCI